VIRAGYERYRTWYPNLYTVVGVTAKAPYTIRQCATFYVFYDQVIFSHTTTVQKLTIDVLDLCFTGLGPEDADSFVVHSFLDRVRMCNETTHLIMNLLSGIRSKYTTRRSESVIMYNLEHLSFTGLVYEPHLLHPKNPAKSNHFLYLLSRRWSLSSSTVSACHTT
jgi:hypothetical protein